MELLYYSAQKQQFSKLVHNIIKEFVSEKDIEICSTVGRLTKRLRQFRNELRMAVLLAATRQELADLLLIHDLLDDMATILILPDREKDTISKGTRIRPRFISYVDSDMFDVRTVLEKMIERLQKSPGA